MFQDTDASSLEFNAPKDPYTYFNIINELCDSKKLNGELLSTDSLQYRIYTTMFIDHPTNTKWKTSISVIVRKSANGSSFLIKPRKSAIVWIIFVATTLDAVIKLFSSSALDEPKLIILLYYIPAIFVFLLDKHHSKKLINEFREKMVLSF